MKYLKLLAIALGVVGFSSCSDYDFTPDAPKVNSKSGVTVSMEDADISFYENKGMVSVPFTVTGERNGAVIVQCTVAEVPETDESLPAIEGAHYIFTSKSIIVSEEDSIGSFEIRLYNDQDENDKRMFVIKLATVQGATISGIEETVVTIEDDDSDPYIRLGGDWVMETSDGNVNFTLNAYTEGEDGYYKYYTATGLFGNGEEIQVDFDYNRTTGEGEIIFEYGQDIEGYDHSSYGYGEGLFAYLTSDYYIMTDGSANFTWNEAGTELTLVSWAGQDDSGADGATFSYLLHFDAGWMIYDNYTGVKVIKKAD